MPFFSWSTKSRNWARSFQDLHVPLSCWMYLITASTSQTGKMLSKHPREQNTSWPQFSLVNSFQVGFPNFRPHSIDCFGQTEEKGCHTSSTACHCQLVRRMVVSAAGQLSPEAGVGWGYFLPLFLTHSEITLASFSVPQTPKAHTQTLGSQDGPVLITASSSDGIPQGGLPCSPL